MEIFSQEFLLLLAQVTLVAGGLIESIKRGLKLSGAPAVILACVVSILSSVMIGYAQGVAWFTIVILSLAVAIETNGWYHFITHRK